MGYQHASTAQYVTVPDRARRDYASRHRYGNRQSGADCDRWVLCLRRDPESFLRLQYRGESRPSCAKIDPRPYQATLDQYSGQLLRDQAILGKDQGDLTRYTQLAAQNSIARQQAEDQVYVVQQDQATVKLDQALVEGAQLNVDYTDIVSPVDGTVVSRNVTQGQTVAASFQTPTLFLIASDLKKMEVDTNVSESDIGGLKEGDESSFTVDAFPKRSFTGKVAQVRSPHKTCRMLLPMTW